MTWGDVYEKSHDYITAATALIIHNKAELIYAYFVHSGCRYIVWKLLIFSYYGGENPILRLSSSVGGTLFEFTVCPCPTCTLVSFAIKEAERGTVFYRNLTCLYSLYPLKQNSLYHHDPSYSSSSSGIFFHGHLFPFLSFCCIVTHTMMM